MLNFPYHKTRRFDPIFSFLQQWSYTANVARPGNNFAAELQILLPLLDLYLGFSFRVHMAMLVGQGRGGEGMWPFAVAPIPKKETDPMTKATFPGLMDFIFKSSLWGEKQQFPDAKGFCLTGALPMTAPDQCPVVFQNLRDNFQKQLWSIVYPRCSQILSVGANMNLPEESTVLSWMRRFKLLSSDNKPFNPNKARVPELPGPDADEKETEQARPGDVAKGGKKVGEAAKKTAEVPAKKLDKTEGIAAKTPKSSQQSGGGFQAVFSGDKPGPENQRFRRGLVYCLSLSDVRSVSSFAFKEWRRICGVFTRNTEELSEEEKALKKEQGGSVMCVLW